MERKKLTELAGVDNEQARHIDAEEIRGFWRGILCSEYPAAEDAPGGVEKVESMIKLSAEILRSGYDVIKEGNGFFLFFYNGMNEERPTDAEIAEAIKEREENPAAAEAEESTKGYCMHLLQTTVLKNELLPFIRAELRRVAADPANNNINMLEYLFSGRPLQSNFVKVLESAAQAQALPAAGQDEAGKYIARPIKKIGYPLDKVNSDVWNLFRLTEKTEVNGQIGFNIYTGSNGKQEALVFYSIDFGAIEQATKFSRQLTQFDKRCYIAAAALYNAGYKFFSLRQLHRAMGFTSVANAAILEKIDASLSKMQVSTITINNQKELEVFGKGNEYEYNYTAPLLPFKKIQKRYRANGQLVESVIILSEEPPLVAFARQRKQITTIDRKLLECRENSKTEENLKIEDYLIERIAHIKAQKQPARILYDTVCKGCNITEKKQRQRLPGKIIKYLRHYKSCNWVKEFTEQKDGVTIIP